MTTILTFFYNFIFYNFFCFARYFDYDSMTRAAEYDMDIKGPIFAPIPWGMSFQSSATEVMHSIINFHNKLMILLVLVTLFVLVIISSCIFFFNETKNKVPSTTVHGTTLEMIWTITPVFILLAIAVPSFTLLYSIDEVIKPSLMIKVTGHQWYWHYDYSFIKSYPKLGAEGLSKMFSFDSYMIPDDELLDGDLRLLEVDFRLTVPENEHITFLITAADVLHSWAVPALGVKVDACPGRINQVSVFINQTGVFYGQCSEICGVNHGFMPIVLQAVRDVDFLTFLNIKLTLDDIGSLKHY